MGTQHRRWLTISCAVIAIAGLIGWYFATRPQPLREVYSEQAWDPIGSLNLAKMMPSKLTLIAGEHLLSNELVGNPRVFDLHGKLLWEFQAAGETSMCCTAGPDGTIYVGTNKNNVYAIGPDYQVQWKFYAEGSKDFMCCPQPGPDGRVYVTASDGVMYALSAEGEELWRVEAPAMSGRRLPLVSATGIVIAPCRDGSAIAYDSEGNELWQTGGVGFNALLPAQPELLVGVSCLTSVSGFNLQGTRLWQWIAPGSVDIMDEFAAGDRVLLQISDPDKLVMLDSAGQVLWDYPCELLARYCVLPDGRTLVVQHPEQSTNPALTLLQDVWYKLKDGGIGKLIVLDQQGHVTAKYTLPFMFATSPPVLLPDGTVLIVGNNGRLYCYEIP